MTISTSSKAKEETNQGISVVIPTYNETENIRPLTERLLAALSTSWITKHLPLEILLVDDESRGSVETVEIMEEIAKEVKSDEKYEDLRETY